MPRRPWAYVGLRDGKMRAVVSGDVEKRYLGKTLAEFAADGLTIVPVKDREEYDKYLKPHIAELEAEIANGL